MYKALFIGCHVDDIELGCGGLLYKRRKEWDCYCATLSRSSYSPFGESGPHPNIWKIQERSLKILGYEKDILFSSHRTNFFENERNDVWATLKCLRDRINPDVVYVNHFDDHQDHQTAYLESLRVFQGCSMICYPTYGSIQNFESNCFESLTSEMVQKKIEALSEYSMYSDKIYVKNVYSQCVSDGTYIKKPFAEKFYVIKLVL